MRRHKCSDSFSYEWIIVSAEAHKPESKLGLGAQEGKKSACEDLRCEWKNFFVCKSGTVLEVIVVTTCMWLINPITNLNAVSVTNTRDNINKMFSTCFMFLECSCHRLHGGSVVHAIVVCESSMRRSERKIWKDMIWGSIQNYKFKNRQNRHHCVNICLFVIGGATCFNSFPGSSSGVHEYCY
jgi:hypothetical protein